MKLRLTILTTLLFQVAFGQIKYGTYRVSSDTFHILTGKNFSELTINSDKTFTYDYRTSVSCFLWYDSHGTWDIKDESLILTDTIISYNPVVEYVKLKDTDNDKISITVKSKDNSPIKGIRINYMFKNSKDTLSGHTDANGNFTIDTRGKIEKAKIKKNAKFRTIDEVEIWVVYFSKKGQDWTSNNFSDGSSDIECVIDDTAIDEKIIRTTTYKIEDSNLIFQAQTFNKDNVRPGRQLFGNFKFEKE